MPSAASRFVSSPWWPRRLPYSCSLCQLRFTQWVYQLAFGSHSRTAPTSSTSQYCLLRSTSTDARCGPANFWSLLLIGLSPSAAACFLASEMTSQCSYCHFRTLGFQVSAQSAQCTIQTHLSAGTFAAISHHSFAALPSTQTVGSNKASSPLGTSTVVSRGASQAWSSSWTSSAFVGYLAGRKVRQSVVKTLVTSW